MSYDLYCFKPSSSTPSLEEAQAVIEAEEVLGQPEVDSARETKRRIADALMQHNPRLQELDFNYAQIAKTMNISEEEARAQWTHVELNPPEGDSAIQITVFGDHVSINTPYWYSGPDADKVFRQLMNYLRVLKRTAGYFVFDPQKDRILILRQKTSENTGHMKRSCATCQVWLLNSLKSEENLRENRGGSSGETAYSACCNVPDNSSHS